MSSRPHEPILLELGEERWEEFTDDIAAWLRNVQLAQSSFRHLAEETAAELEDPRVKEMIQRIAESAKDHEQKVDELYWLIGHEPSDITKMLGEVTARGRQLLGNVLGITGGASGPWHDLRQMLLANLNAIGAFGAVEQLGLTLGLPELAQVAFSVVRDKSTEQLVIEEYMLELAPQAILYGKQVQRSAKPVDHPEQYPPQEPEGTQPHLPLPGRPKASTVGNQMGGNEQEAAHEQHKSSDYGGESEAAAGDSTWNQSHDADRR